MQEALGKSQRRPASPHPRLQEKFPQIAENARAARSRAQDRRQELLTELAEVSQSRGWKVCRTPNLEEGLEYICNLATARRATLVVRSDQEVFQEVLVDDPLSSIGVEITVMAQASGLSQETLREHAAKADLGITGVDYAIAETGSVVVLPRKGLSRLVSLVPPVHVAIVRPEEIVESLDDLFILRRLAYHQGDGDMGSYMNFITGPSRTADIEQTLVIGVHGPKEAHLVLLG